VWLDFVDPLKVRDKRTYRVVFDDTTKTDTILYSLSNVTDPGNVIAVFRNSKYLKGEDFNPMFDGMRLQVRNDTIDWNPSGTGWIKGNSNTVLTLYLDPITKQTYFPKRKPGYPSSYEIRVGPSDTSYLFNSQQGVANFQVWDVTENKKMRYYLKEPAGQENRRLDAGDYIDLWYSIGPRAWIRFWRINIVAPPEGTTINPDSSDVAYIKINAPFRSGDVFEFTTIAAKVDQDLARASLQKIAVVPNPYVGAASWEAQRLTQSGRGERKIDFIHLPQVATINIYTVSGEFVKVLHHEGDIIDGAEAWNLRSEDNMDVAPGVYVYYVDAPGVGTMIGKFAVIK